MKDIILKLVQAGLYDEGKELLEILASDNPDSYRKQHGKCPRGFRYDSEKESCVPSKGGGAKPKVNVNYDKRAKQLTPEQKKNLLDTLKVSDQQKSQDKQKKSDRTQELLKMAKDTMRVSDKQKSGDKKKKQKRTEDMKKNVKDLFRASEKQKSK